MSTEVADNTKAIDRLLKGFARKFGSESVILGKNISYKGEVIPTGSLLVDQALGIGGIPRGRFVELFGAESSGKTTFSSSIIAQAQKRGLVCAFVDAEATYDKDWAARIGVNLDELIFTQPSHIEEGLDMVTYMVENGVDLIVFDSIAGISTLSELKGDSGDRNIAEKARILSRWTSSVNPKLREHNSTIILLNQVRETMALYGSPLTTPGGRAVRHVCSVRMQITKKAIREKQEVIGDTVRLRIVKNKLAPPMKSAETTLLFDRGFDVTTEIVQLAIELGFIERAGAWFKPTFLLEEGDDPEKMKRLQGQDNLLEFLKETDGALEKLEALVRENLSNLDIPVDDEGDEEDEPDF